MSENKESLFKKIDTFLFKQVDVFKASAVYAKIQEPMSLMDDEVRLYVNNSIAILFVIIPLFFLGFFLYLNLNLRSENKIKKEILSVGQEIIVNRGEVNSTAQMLILNGIDNEMSLNQKIKSIASTSGIDGNKLQVSQFTTDSGFAGTNRISAIITVNRFSANDLTHLLNSLIYRERIKVSGMNLRKNETEAQLDGIINITFNSQPMMNPGEENSGFEQ
jgi:hypothetical protein